MTHYNEQEVQAFGHDAANSFREAGEQPNDDMWVWVGRMQFDAVYNGYEWSRAKHLNELRVQLGLEEPAPIPPPPNSDQIDLSTAVIVKGPAHINDWPSTSVMELATQGNDSLCTYHSMLGVWPNVPLYGDATAPTEGNQWVFAFIDGAWYGGANDWYRPGQACKEVTAETIGHDGFSEEPLHSWVPKVGEEFGVMVSTPARAWPDMATLDERSNVVLLRWS